MGSNTDTRILAVINNKGGVGKTVLTTELPVLIARAGHKVLLVDMDPQRNLTLNMGFFQADQPVPELTIAQSIHDPATFPLAEAILPVKDVPNLYMVPGHTALAEVGELIAAGALSDTRLDDLFDDLLNEDGGAFDWIFIDCPPGLGVLSTNALIAADEVMVPVDLRNTNSLVGVNYLLKKIQTLGKRAPARGLFLVGNMFSEPGGKNSANDQQDNLAMLPGLGYPVAETVIKSRTAIFKAHNRNSPLTLTAEGLSKGGKKATDNLADLASELMENRIQGKPVAVERKKKAAA